MAAGSIDKLPLVVIVSPTASGKTALAVELAEQLKGEIICADSRTVYKEMDIGTAKPTPEEQAKVPHWGLDLVEPGEYFSAAQFKHYAESKIEEIRQRGHIPFLVGGSGLYIDSVLFDYRFGAPSDPLLRTKLEQMSLEELHYYCISYNINLPENSKNKRYVIRAIEQKSINTKRRPTPINNSIVVGISTTTSILRERIQERAEQLFQHGVVEEAIKLGEKYGWEGEAMKSNIYPLLRNYLNNQLSRDEVKRQFVIADWHLAKRQLTWLKRNPFIRWGTLAEVKNYLLTVLANE